MARGAPTNPSVNRYLEDLAMDHIDHALGRPVDPMSPTYRNHFATDGALADEFSASPHWEERGRQGSMRHFSVTEAGRAALADHLKSLPIRYSMWEVTFEGHTWNCAAPTRAKARYSEWLSISDSCCDLTFAAFCRNARVRRVA